MTGTAAAGIGPLAEEGQVRRTEVSFTVSHPGRSESCRVRGGLYLPPDGTCQGVQLALHGFSYGAWMWDPPGRTDYSYARYLAARGWPVVAVDLPGCGTSDRPDGYALTLDALSAMAHELVLQLRRGSYQGEVTPAFERVVLAGHSAGGEVAGMAARRFGGADGLIVMAMGAVSAAATQAAMEHVLPQARSSDYIFPWFGGEECRLQLFYQHATNTTPDEGGADPQVMEQDRRLQQPVASGHFLSMAGRPTVAALEQVAAPVLLVFADNDHVVPVSEAETEAARYASASDLEVVVVPNVGHTMVLHRNRHEVYAAVAAWLAAHPEAAPRCRMEHIGIGGDGER